MLWLEMSRDPGHGGGDWDFTRTLWSPAYKRTESGEPGGKWPFWEGLLQVRAGDPVLHLRGRDEAAAFVGFSTAETDGFETTVRPPEPGAWGYANRFYRVPLVDYVPFPVSIPLRSVFTQHDAELRDYFRRNAGRVHAEKKRLFYVIQSGRLQCLNGAYFSEIEDELATILLGSEYLSSPVIPAPAANTGFVSGPVTVNTASPLRELRIRQGQSAFSRAVRANYGSRCCFPGCSVREDMFLVGAHIARWADAPELRGELSNGLCLCVMHDRAFEQGLFSFGPDHRVVVKAGIVKQSPWGREHVLPALGKLIQSGRVLPSVEALRRHWSRVGLHELL